ncbi:MAG: PAS domain S-box protein [Pseudomonadota bacterium]
MVNFRKSLAFQLAFPLILSVFLTAGLVHGLVIRAVSDFVRMEIKRDLNDLSQELFFYCNQGVEGQTLEVGRSGPAEDPTLQRASTLRRIKDFSLRNGVAAFVFDAQTGSTLLNTGLSPRLMELLRDNLVEGIADEEFDVLGPSHDRFFAKEFDFSPWGWRVVILRTEARYAGLGKMVRQAHLNTLAIAVVGAFFLVFFLNRVVRRPIRAIVEPIRNGKAPSYQGLDVFEFLSNSVAGLIESLAASEEKYRLVVENALEGIVVAQDGRFKFFNPKAMDMLGLSRGELKSDLLLDYIHPLDRDLVMNNHFRRLALGGSQPPDAYSFRVVDAAGVTKLVEITVVVISWQGRPATLSFLADVTEKKKGEESLRASESRSRAMLDAIPDLMFRLNRDGLLLDHHPASGDSGAELDFTGRTIAEVRPDLAAITMEKTGLALESGQIQIYEFEVKENSRGNYFEARMVPCGDDEVLTIVRDITARKNADREIRQSENRYRSLVENIFYGLFISQTTTGRFLELNKRFCEIFGYSMKDALTKTLWDIISAEDHQIMRARAVAKFTGKFFGPDSFVYTGIKKDGTEFRVEISGTPVHYQGALVMQGVVRDVTEKERLEKQLQQAQKMEAVGSLASGLAHDFNNLIQVIQSYTELLLSGKSKSDGGLKELQEISKAAGRASDLTRNLLTLGRKMDARLKPLDLNHQVRQIVGLLERIIPRMIRIELNLRENLPLVNGDASQIEQVLINLAVNSRDAMPEGGRLALETESTTLTEEYCRNHIGATPGRYVLLSVSDTGYGMTAEEAERIFEPFFTTKDVGKGAGLGLAMVYGIIKNHQGRILCYSEKGVGTTFKIYLPATEQGPEIEEEKRPPEKLRGGNETILLVDDEETLRELGREILAEYGYRVITAQCGEEAIEVFRRERGRIDLVILDLIMPGMGGRKAMREILNLAPAQRIIVVSGYSANGPVRDLIREGAKGFVGKPYRINQLLQSVRAVLDGRPLS